MKKAPEPHKGVVKSRSSPQLVQGAEHQAQMQGQTQRQAQAQMQTQPQMQVQTQGRNPSSITPNATPFSAIDLEPDAAPLRRDYVARRKLSEPPRIPKHPYIPAAEYFRQPNVPQNLSQSTPELSSTNHRISPQQLLEARRAHIQVQEIALRKKEEDFKRNYELLYLQKKTLDVETANLKYARQSFAREQAEALTRQEQFRKEWSEREEQLAKKEIILSEREEQIAKKEIILSDHKLRLDVRAQLLEKQMEAFNKNKAEYEQEKEKRKTPNKKGGNSEKKPLLWSEQNVTSCFDWIWKKKGKGNKMSI